MFVDMFDIVAESEIFHHYNSCYLLLFYIYAYCAGCEIVS